MHPLLATIALLTASNVFMPFAWLYLKEPPKLDYLWAALCLLGAAFFIFRSRWFGT